MTRGEDHGLYGVVFALAILVVVVVVYFGARRFGKRPPSQRPSPSRRAHPPDDGVDRPPNRLSPLRLAPGQAPKPRTEQREPPSVPMPPIEPDVEDAR